MEFEVLENSSGMAAGGAGISTAQMIADKGVEVVLTGNCGPNAYQTLSAAGIQVVSGVSGRVRDAVEAYRTGRLQPSARPSVGSHYGMGMGVGMGPEVIPQAAPRATSPEQETEVLKRQAQIMAQQLSEIQRRIEELEKGR